jgi:hypothetical protein
MFQRKVLFPSLSCTRRQQIPLKHWYLSTRLYCIISWSGQVSKQTSERMVQKVRQWVHEPVDELSGWGCGRVNRWWSGCMREWMIDEVRKWVKGVRMSEGVCEWIIEWMKGWMNTRLIKHLIQLETYYAKIGTAVAQWLRYCAKNRKVAGSIPDGVMEFLIDINPSDHTMALGSTQPLTEKSNGSISWG